MKLGPALDFFGVSVEELPANRPGHAEPAIIGSASADADQTAPCSFARYQLQKIAKALAVEFERVIFARRQLRQPDDSRGFDDGCLCLRVPPPEGIARPVGGIDCFYGLRNGANEPA